MEALDTIRQELTRATTLLRLGQDAAGNDAMVMLIDLLWKGLSSGSITAPTDALNRVLPQLINAQEAGDYLWVADMLEHELLLVLAEKS